MMRDGQLVEATLMPGNWTCDDGHSGDGTCLAGDNMGGVVCFGVGGWMCVYTHNV